jgi:hypothetical protein
MPKHASNSLNYIGRSRLNRFFAAVGGNRTAQASESCGREGTFHDDPLTRWKRPPTTETRTLEVVRFLAMDFA